MHYFTFETAPAFAIKYFQSFTSWKMAVQELLRTYSTCLHDCTKTQADSQKQRTLEGRRDRDDRCTSMNESQWDIKCVFPHDGSVLKPWKLTAFYKSRRKEKADSIMIRKLHRVIRQSVNEIILAAVTVCVDGFCMHFREVKIRLVKSNLKKTW